MGSRKSLLSIQCFGISAVGWLPICCLFARVQGTCSKIENLQGGSHESHRSLFSKVKFVLRATVCSIMLKT
jgi:hypothetical protein